MKRRGVRNRERERIGKREAGKGHITFVKISSFYLYLYEENASKNIEYY